MRTILALFVGIIVGAAAIWMLSTGKGQREARQAGERIEEVTKSGYETFQQQIRQWRLTPDDIKQELSSGGQVVRKKAQQASDTVADATADARTTATLKAKFLADGAVPATGISVDTTAGVVTLAGAVTSADEISRAMALALEVEGVREVISTLQVKGSGPTVARQSAGGHTNPPAASQAAPSKK